MKIKQLPTDDSPDPMARRDIIRLEAAETMMREVLFAPEVSRWWPDVVPELLLALSALDKARKILEVHKEVQDG